MAKSTRKGKFRPLQLRNRLIDFDEIRTSELSLKTAHQQNLISIRRCAWSQRTPNLPLSLKRQFRDSGFPK